MDTIGLIDNFFCVERIVKPYHNKLFIGHGLFMRSLLLVMHFLLYNTDISMGNITYDNNGLMTSNYNVKSCILYVSVYSNHFDFE